jgi:hypothetical protein
MSKQRNGSWEAIDEVERSFRRQDWPAAIDGCNRILASDSMHVGALEIKAKAEWATLQFTDLLSTLNTLTRLNPYEPGYHHLRGAAFQCLERFEEARLAFERAGACSGAREAATELEIWQAGEIERLLELDLVFRTEFRRDASAACARRGFKYLATRGPQGFVAVDMRRPTSHIRPS